MTIESNVEESPSTILVDEFNAGRPEIYADQVMAVAFGPFVSKFVLGMENHGLGKRTSVATVIMPTNTLHQLARAILDELEKAPTVARIVADHNKFTQVLERNQSEVEGK